MKQKYLKKILILSISVICVGLIRFIPVHATESTTLSPENIEEASEIQPRDINYYEGKLWEQQLDNWGSQ